MDSHKTHPAQLEFGKLADNSLEDAGLMEQCVQDRQEHQRVEEDGQRRRQRRSEQPEGTEDGVQQHGGGMEGDCRHGCSK